MAAVTQLSDHVGVQPACEALCVNRACFYRRRRAQLHPPEQRIRPRPPLALASSERQEVLDTLHSERFVDQAPPVIYATLLDESRYLCSVRTMYRILAQENEVRERRNQRRHPHYTKPELIATGPNQVWSWDITKLKGPAKWTYFHLYVILDIFSRLVVGWLVAHRESAELAKRLIRESCKKQSIEPEQLILHADRGSSMKSKSVAFLLADLWVTKTHSRPHVSNDNLYSETQFKTLKYRPEFPQRFGCLQDAQSHCRTFFDWYNTQHLHSGIAMLTPQAVHYGEADTILKHRTEILETARMKNSVRFKGKSLTLPELPEAAWINKPSQDRKQVQEEPDIRA
ncbi:MAG: IS3 family transposase [Candidatus Thiodiazotropha sp. (ex Lucinoma aequizonata)]|nr:IS3 family transposase [Candidatus Thiodiazotropha sp. (ex Lucinoma aequizonata)]